MGQKMRRRRRLPSPHPSMGSTPRWDDVGGPRTALTAYARSMYRKTRSARWMLALNHVHSEWAFTYATLVTAGGRGPEPLEFTARIARRYYQCPTCRGPEATKLWEKALPFTGADDVVKLLVAESKR